MASGQSTKVDDGWVDVPGTTPSDGWVDVPKSVTAAPDWRAAQAARMQDPSYRARIAAGNQQGRADVSLPERAIATTKRIIDPILNTEPGTLGAPPPWVASAIMGSVPGGAATEGMSLGQAAGNGPLVQTGVSILKKLSLANPDNLALRAAANREAYAASKPILEQLDLAKPGTFLKPLDTATQPVRAAIQSKLAELSAAQDTAPVFNVGPAPPRIEGAAPIPPSPGTAPMRTPDNIPPIQEAQRGPFPGEQRQPIGAQRPAPPTLAMNTDNVPEMMQGVDMKPPAGPSRPIEMANPPTGDVAPKLSGLTAPELNKWMNVAPKQMVHGANPAQQILTDGLLGPTKETTLANVDAALQDAGGQMQTALAEAGKRGVRINAEQPIMDGLDNATKTIGKRTDPAFQNALSNIIDDILHKHPDLRTMPPVDVHSLKVDVGDAITWGKGTAYEGDINTVLRDIYGKLNDTIKANVDGIGPLQSRWGNLYQGVKALKGSLVRDAVGRGTGSIPVGKVVKPTMGTMLMENLKRTGRP